MERNIRSGVLEVFVHESRLVEPSPRSNSTSQKEHFYQGRFVDSREFG